MVDARLLAYVERLGQEFNQTHLDGNIGIGTFLNQVVRQHYKPQSHDLTSMGSEVYALMVTVTCWPGLGGSGEISRDLMVTVSSGSPTRHTKSGSNCIRNMSKTRTTDGVTPTGRRVNVTDSDNLL